MRNDCIILARIVVLEKILESPLDCKEINPANPKKNINPAYSLKGLMLRLKLQHLGHLMRRAISFEKTLKLGKIEGKRRRGQQRIRQLDSITKSMDMNLSKLQETVEDRGGLVLQSMGSQKVRHDLVSEQQQQHYQET